MKKQRRPWIHPGSGTKEESLTREPRRKRGVTKFWKGRSVNRHKPFRGGPQKGGAPREEKTRRDASGVEKGFERNEGTQKLAVLSRAQGAGGKYIFDYLGPGPAGGNIIKRILDQKGGGKQSRGRYEEKKKRCRRRAQGGEKKSGCWLQGLATYWRSEEWAFLRAAKGSVATKSTVRVRRVGPEGQEKKRKTSQFKPRTGIS